MIDRSRQPEQKNGLEWFIFFTGLALILALVTYLVIQMAVMRDHPPRMELQFSQESVSGPGTVKVIVTNTGDETAADVMVKATLSRNGEMVEEADIVFPFVPRQATRIGWCQFSVPFGSDSLSVRVSSYRKS